MNQWEKRQLHSSAYPEVLLHSSPQDSFFPQVPTLSFFLCSWLHYALLGAAVSPGLSLSLTLC